VEALAEFPREGVELRLTAPAAVEGRVTLDNGAPAFRVFMLVSLGDRWPERACISMAYTFTDAQGHYRIGDLPAEEAVVMMLGAMEQLDAPSALPRVLPVLLEAGRTEWLAAMTSEQGAYEFGDLRTGRYQLFLVEGAGASVVRCGSVEFLGGGDQRYDLQLPGATIAGSLRDGRSHAPLPNGVVIVLASEPGRDPEFAARVNVGADARFDCGPLPAGRYRVQGHANEAGWSESQAEVELPAERAEVTLDLELFPGGRLTVLAADEEGQPLPGAAVELLSPAGPRVDFAEHQLTDASGAFRVRGLSVGDWTVRVALAGRRPAEQRVSVRVGEEASVRLALPALP